MAPFGLKLWEDAFQTIPNISFFDAENVGNKNKNYKTLNGRLPPEDGSVRPQTLGKRVSDDPRHFIFRHRKKNLDDFFTTKNLILEVCFQETGDLGEPDTFERHWQIRRKK